MLNSLLTSFFIFATFPFLIFVQVSDVCLISTVSVGYEYYICNEVAWSVQAVMLDGITWSTTSMGGWFFPIHHTYDPTTGESITSHESFKLVFILPIPLIFPLD